MNEAERIPNRKNFMDPSFDFWSPGFQPDRRNIGVEANSIPINIVNKSLEEVTTKAPSSELSNRK